MKFCVSTNVGTWTNWLTFEPDPDINPDAGTGKSESRRSVEVDQTGTSLRAGCKSRDALQRDTVYSTLQSKSQSFAGPVDFSVRSTVAELRGVKLAQFSDFGLCRGQALHSVPFQFYFILLRFHSNFGVITGHIRISIRQMATLYTLLVLRLLFTRTSPSVKQHRFMSTDNWLSLSLLPSGTRYKFSRLLNNSLEMSRNVSFRSKL